MTVAFPMLAMDASAAPWPTNTPGVEDLTSFWVSTDMRISGTPVLSNGSSVQWLTYSDPDYFDWSEEANSAWWDSDPGYYYREFVDATDGDYGTSTLIVRPSSPVEENDYYELKVVLRVGIWDGYNGTDPDSDCIFDFLTSDTQELWVTLGYEGEDGVEYFDRFPETGQHSQIQPPDDGTILTPLGWNLRGTSVDYSAAGSATEFQYHPTVVLDGNGTYYGFGKTTYHTFDENPAEGRPWSYDEVENIQARLYIAVQPSIFDWATDLDYNMVLAVSQFYVVAIPVDYTPDTTIPGSFVLRPDSDLSDIEGWTNESGDASPLYAAVDETDYYSDRNATFVSHTPPASEDWLGFGFTDPPETALDTTYNLTFWMVNQVSDLSYSVEESSAYTVTVMPHGDYEYAQTSEVYTLFEFWGNFTFSVPPPSSDSDGWTLEQLAEIESSIVSHLILGAIVNISQVAILCEPGVYIPSEWDEEEDFALSTWLVTGGIPTIFGVIGFIGMIAIPAVAIVMAREGEGGYEALLSCAMLFLVFLGFFLTAVFVSS
ncbi:MAG: hypothetical protein JW765_00185 [Deltaproteobacteria bacterium]|nr:hypothetical protein [Candidatus Zymogenaceae bacterium]